MKRPRSAPQLVAIVMLCVALSPHALAQQAAGQGIAAAPQFTPGLVLRYQLDVRTLHDGDTTGVVENPQGGNRFSVRFGAVLRLEALEQAAGEQAAGAPQLRATIEQVSVVIGGDTFDPAATGLEQRYRQLEGYSVAFSGGDDRQPQPAAPNATPRDPQLQVTAQNWMRMLVSRIGAPAGAAPGSAWSDEQPLAASPLKETVLRTASNYLRDEPCGGQGERAAVNVPSLATEDCAVVLTRSSITQAGARRDPTPDAYRERGLRTSGRWEGTGESLAYVSRRTGWLVSVTETQSEQMDFTVTRGEDEIILRQRGTVETQSHLLLQSVETRK